MFTLPRGDFQNLLEVVSLLIAFGVFVVGAISVSNRRKINRAAQDTRAVKDQVVNSHVDNDGNPLNFRDEQDERHMSNVDLLSRTLKTVVSLRTSTNKNFENVRDELEGMREDIRRADGRILDLERTRPPVARRKAKP